MSHIHLIHWLMNFLGVNNTYNDFSTHMYNFWSGFGANISLLAVSGAVVGVYRHNLNRLNAINPATLIQKMEEQIQKEKENKEKR